MDPVIPFAYLKYTIKDTFKYIYSYHSSILFIHSFIQSKVSMEAHNGSDSVGTLERETDAKTAS